MYFVLSIAAIFTLSHALYSPKGSACSIQCGTKAQNYTGPDDLVCLDTAYEDTSIGQLLKGCISCLSTSTYVNSAASFNGNSDQWWFLWHIKHVQETCLVDFPQTTAASNCVDQCSPMKACLDTSWLYSKRGVQPQYAVCSWNSSQYMTYGEGCASCLQGQEGGVIIGNFADITYNSCKTQPYAANGDLVALPRDLFDTTLINGSAAATSSAIATKSTSSPSGKVSTSKGTTASKTNSGATSGTAAANSDSKSSSSSKSGGLSSAAAAGVGIAAALAILALAAGLLFALRKRKQKASSQQRLNTPPEHAEAPLYTMQPQETGGKEKHKVHVSELDVKSVPLQELDVKSVSRHELDVKSVPIQELDGTAVSK